MTDYTELKSKLRNGIDFDDSKEAADAIESLDRQIAELSKDAEPEELRSLINKAQSHMMRTREADQVSVALTQYLIAAAPKQEKGNEPLHGREHQA